MLIMMAATAAINYECTIRVGLESPRRSIGTEINHSSRRTRK